MIALASQVSTKTFDYILIHGAQTSGLTVAARLSEDPSVSVLVIEAGPANLDDPDLRKLTPAAFGTHFGKPQYDWAFQTIPQEFCKGRTVPFNRGKGLGGSSAINFFQYHRPAKSDIDSFGELGNDGWNWDLLEQYYSKSERFIQPLEKTDTMSYDLAHHGTKGPLAVAYPSAESNFEAPFQQALKNVGINLVKEPFSGDTNGTWVTPVTIDPEHRVRSYSANKYYQPNASRENLTVVVSAHVTKIGTELDPNGSATAVEVVFKSEDALYTVKVGKEVILSAGAIMSPQILELSGIGDKPVLEAAGIETRVHLPGVGNNVQEHIFANVTCELLPEVASNFLNFDVLGDPREYLRQQELYKTSGKGVFATCPASIAFVPLASISPASEALQKSVFESINAAVSSQQISPGLRKQYLLQLEHLKEKQPSCEFILSPRYMPGPKPPLPGQQYVTVSGLINHPFSRGSIHIASSDPLVPPSIDPKYFEHSYDLLQFVEQIKFCRKVLEQEPLRKFLTGTELLPGPEVQTDEQIADYIRDAFSTTWHTVGSCSMLPLADGGVVDKTLKVHKTTNIRVVDISVVPLHIGAHMQATAYAIGEIAADIIKGKVLKV
ncbi:GMC oxidoreductase [Mycena rosella]|uniref:GMC oxidoreductase n=1 Tax=Mycena rosella TaxID=1033263 RepID=A0AAD7GZV5_MYCRO|nr:GMC oxidoreductase [Mycena rosella]